MTLACLALCLSECYIHTHMVQAKDISVRSQRVRSWEDVGTRVAAARTAAGFTQQELADRLGIHRSALTRIEQGQRQIDALELVGLAEALGRPVDWFVRLAPPTIASHRRVGGEDGNIDRLEDELESVARDVLLLHEIGELRPPQQSHLSTEDLETLEEAEAAAVAAREMMAPDVGPLHDLQMLTEGVGLYAFSLDLGPTVIDGGYVRLNGLGAAVINGTVDAGRRRFSLAHELGHHLLADEYSTDFAIGRAREAREGLINAFAIHLLMPRRPVVQRWEQLHADGHDDREALITIAAEYRVSWSAACNQARTLGLVAAPERTRLLSQRPTTVDYIELGVQFAEELQPVSVPPGFARAALGAHRRYKIGRDRAVELLRGTVPSDDLPEPDELPMDALRDDFAGLD